jgi:hypothetical protein
VPDAERGGVRGSRPPAGQYPLCPVIDSTDRLTFVTLRGGGLLVVDRTTTPMAILVEYDRATVHPNGCGGAEAAGKIYIRASAACVTAATMWG